MERKSGRRLYEINAAGVQTRLNSYSRSRLINNEQWLGIHVNIMTRALAISTGGSTGAGGNAPKFGEVYNVFASSKNSPHIRNTKSTKINGVVFKM